MLTFLVPVLFAFYIQGELKFKFQIPVPKGYVFMKPGSLNLLEPSGPVKACNGIPLPFPLFTNKIEVTRQIKYGLFY
jgi:hypothetical protein